MFADEAGSYLNADALRARYKAALQRAGLPAMRLHDMRHCAASLLVRVLPLHDVKAILGHSTLAVTEKYLHHRPRHDTAARVQALVDTAVAPQLQVVA